MDDLGNLQAVLATADFATADLIVSLQIEDAIARSTEQQAPNMPAEEAAANENMDDESGQLKTSQAIQKPNLPSPPPITCDACQDEFSSKDIFKAPCREHQYCRACIEQLFEAAMVDETLFPPRCCTIEIHWGLAKKYLSHEVWGKFMGKRLELQTKDRTYCHVRFCSAFIKPSRIELSNNEAPCHAMTYTDGPHYTCSVCKGRWHEGGCPENRTTRMLENMAAINGWQRCSECRHVLELSVGCDHMTCPCGHEFCYACGATWKSCECPQWSEDRLLERAEQVVAEGRVAADVDVDKAADLLRANHECAHEQCKGIGEQGKTFDCDICGKTYEDWIMKCQDCFVYVCNWCKKHRL